MSCAESHKQVLLNILAFRKSGRRQPLITRNTLPVPLPEASHARKRYCIYAYSGKGLCTKTATCSELPVISLMNCNQRNPRTCNIEELLGDRCRQRCSLQEGLQLSSRKLAFRNRSRSVMSLPAPGSRSSPSLYCLSGFPQQTAGANDGFHRPVTLCSCFLVYT